MKNRYFTAGFIITYMFILSPSAFGDQDGNTIIFLEGQGNEQPQQKEGKKPEGKKYIGDVASGKCIPEASFSGSSMHLVFDSLESCEKSAKIENRGCRFGTKPYACCEAIPWNPYCTTSKFAGGCALSIDDANARCAASAFPRPNHCVRWRRESCS